MKKYILLLITLSTLYNISFGQECFTIGQEYEGGIIFYIDETGAHGLIAAPNDIAIFPSTWGCEGTTAPTAQKVAIGSGFENTQAILNNCNEPNTGAVLVSEFEINGFDDWYLPAINELEILYLHRNIVGGFEEGNEFPSIYMSSSESLFNGGFYGRCYVYDFSATQLVESTRKINTSKDNNSLYVRPIRSF